MLFLNTNNLNEIVKKYQKQYQSAEPFPHVVIDHFLPEEPLKQVEEIFPSQNDVIEWRKGDDTFQKSKTGFSDVEYLNEPLRTLLFELNSLVTLRFLEKLTGLKGLVSDPYYLGGGIHQIGQGGFLKVHHDFTKHTYLPNLERKINLLIYLNSEWQEEYGGHLELWDSQMQKCHHRISPIFNRCVIFNTDKFSYHGHPDPLTCPPERTRKSVALYYYSTVPENYQYDDFLSVWHARPKENLPHQDNLPYQEGINFDKAHSHDVQKSYYVRFKEKFLKPLKQKYPLLNALNERRKKWLHIE